MSEVNFIVRPGAITICLGADVKTIPESAPEYSSAVSAAKSGDKQALVALLRPADGVKNSIEGYPNFSFDGATVKYKGDNLPQALANRMLAMIKQGFSVTPLVEFYKNLEQNPSYRAVQELFGFLDACNLPITDDGHFLAYKRIRADFKDCYTGTIDNSVGAVVEVPRNKVDEDSRRTCSYGLHVCSQAYLSHYTGEVIVECKVNPRDVVAVPADYNDSKMRVCRYEVLSVVEEGGITPLFKATKEPTPAPAPKQYRTESGRFVSAELVERLRDATASDYKWVAMDYDGEVYAFKNMPIMSDRTRYDVWLESPTDPITQTYLGGFDWVFNNSKHSLLKIR